MRVMEHMPPQPVELSDQDKAVFLAGPIQGAPDWQANAIEIFSELPSRNPVHIFNPRRPGEFDGKNYQEQIYWNRIISNRQLCTGLCCTGLSPETTQSHTQSTASTLKPPKKSCQWRLEQSSSSGVLSYP